MEHLISIFSDLNSAEEYSKSCQGNYLFLNKSSIGVTIRISITTIIVVFGTMSWSISYQNSITGLATPVLA